MIGGIELGGTKTVVAVGEPDGTLREEHRYPTTTPEETLGTAARWLAERGPVAALGIGAFGPVDIRPASPTHGRMLNTPKPGWSGADLLDPLREALPDVPLHLDTDVNAALLAEVRLGVARGLRNAAYITIGTGIGGAFFIDGRLVHGSLHPEFGHFKVPRHEDDSFSGLCPSHRDCLEGLASGPAIEGRWGQPASGLPPDHPAWAMEAHYLAHGILAIVALTCPECVVVGGGVSQADGLHDRIEDALRELAGGYFPALQGDQPLVRAPELGQDAGIRGALLLATWPV